MYIKVHQEEQEKQDQIKDDLRFLQKEGQNLQNQQSSSRNIQRLQETEKLTIQIQEMDKELLLLKESLQRSKEISDQENQSESKQKDAEGGL